MALSFGINDLGTVYSNSIFASTRNPRQIDIVINGSQGVLPKGTILQKADDGKYVIYDGTKAMAGVLNEEFDTTNGDVTAYMLFDCDLDIIAIDAATTISVGFNKDSLINFIGAS